MNQQLANQILLHIYRNLGINNAANISIMSDKFLLPRNLSFMDKGVTQVVKLWGAQISIDKIKFRILCGDFSTNIQEYVLLIKLDNCPTYGCSLSIDDGDPDDGMILFSLKDNEWLQSNTYIQATFLAGMEQLRDVGAAWDTLSKYDDLVENVKSLVEYHDASFGDEGDDEDEG